jgi:RNA polymerase sigma factor (sigma-70 family)
MSDPLQHQTDEQLFERYRKGDNASFRALIERHHDELLHFLIRLVGDRQAAEDVFQETFLQIHQSAAGFDMERRFRPWMFTIAANKGRDWLRRKARRRGPGSLEPRRRGRGWGGAGVHRPARGRRPGSRRWNPGPRTRRHGAEGPGRTSPLAPRNPAPGLFPEAQLRPDRRRPADSPRDRQEQAARGGGGVCQEMEEFWRRSEPARPRFHSEECGWRSGTLAGPFGPNRQPVPAWPSRPKRSWSVGGGSLRARGGFSGCEGRCSSVNPE